MKCLLLYLDVTDEPDGFNQHESISNQFPDRDSIFQVTKTQEDMSQWLATKSNLLFVFPIQLTEEIGSNLTRVNGLPQYYTLREEYVRCGKDKINKCKSCRHGPYFYAYWREKVSEHNNYKLRKKYLGTIDPRL